MESSKILRQVCDKFLAEWATDLCRDDFRKLFNEAFNKIKKYKAEKRLKEARSIEKDILTCMDRWKDHIKDRRNRAN